MALKQIPKEKKEAYNAIVKDLKEQVEIIQKKAQKLEREGMKEKTLNAFYTRIAACNVYMDTVKLYCKMNEYSLQIMEIKNDLYLSNARKDVYQAIKMLESIFGAIMDTSLTENTETIEQLTMMNPKRYLYLMKKIEYCITLVEYSEGDNSKWKWAFVDMYGKFAVVSKNMTNFKDYINRMYSPADPYYEDVNEIIRLNKKALDTAAQKFRTKYELSTMDVQDMNKAIELLNQVVKIYIILNEQEIAQDTKKTIEKWKDKMDLDLKKKDEELKKSKQAQVQKPAPFFTKK